MLKKIMQILLYVCLFAVTPGYGWKFEQNVVIEGVLRRAERTITKNVNGTPETKIERSIVLVTDEPLILSRSVTLGGQQLVTSEDAYPHIGVYLPTEFTPLIGKRVQCTGSFERTFDWRADEIMLSVDTALDYEQLGKPLKTVFYEPEEVELSGMLYKVTYPGPPEYMSVEMGDRPEEATILTLKDPIDVESKEKDDFNEPEKGVRELQVVFSDSKPSADQMKKELTLRGTLYHAHTAHHHRRVLMMVKDWEAK